jgi:hypothetical protein
VAARIEGDAVIVRLCNPLRAIEWPDGDFVLDPVPDEQGRFTARIEEWRAIGGDCEWLSVTTVRVYTDMLEPWDDEARTALAKAAEHSKPKTSNREDAAEAGHQNPIKEEP